MKRSDPWKERISNNTIMDYSVWNWEEADALYDYFYPKIVLFPINNLVVL